MIRPFLDDAIAELAELLPRLRGLAPELQRLASAMHTCFSRRGKVMTCGNGGSAADAMHLAEELSIRYHKARRGLPAFSLLDPTALTFAANDLGYEQVFAHQVEALGNEGDILIGMSTSGNSPSVVRAMHVARERRITTCSFIGKTGGQLKGVCDIELLVPHDDTARVQEAHKILFHSLCAWLDTQFD